jgi:hypothetical protein
MNNNQNKIIGCLGVPFPADSTLINKSKKELINMLHIAEHNYQVQVETNINQYQLLKTYYQNYSFYDFLDSLKAEKKIDWSEENENAR